MLLALLSATGPEVDPGIAFDVAKWVAASASAAVATYYAMKAKVDAQGREIVDLKAWREKQETAAKEARQEAERQQEAWWREVDALAKGMAALDKTCSNATTETRALLQALKERVDLHSTTTVTSLAGVVKNYNDMLIETVEVVRQIRTAKG